MRTTLDLPENLLNAAMKATHIKTKTKNYKPLAKFYQQTVIKY